MSKRGRGKAAGAAKASTLEAREKSTRKAAVPGSTGLRSSTAKQSALDERATSRRPRGAATFTRPSAVARKPAVPSRGHEAVATLVAVLLPFALMASVLAATYGVRSSTVAPIGMVRTEVGASAAKARPSSVPTTAIVVGWSDLDHERLVGRSLGEPLQDRAPIWITARHPHVDHERLVGRSLGEPLQDRAPVWITARHPHVDHERLVGRSLGEPLQDASLPALLPTAHQCVAQSDPKLGHAADPAELATLDDRAFGRRLAAVAMMQIGDLTYYDARYRRIAFPMGDVPALYGVCTDVVIRAYRALGIDLQVLVYRSGVGSGDRSIDHRRTETLRRFLARHGHSMPVSDIADDYRPGDIVTYHRPQNRSSTSHIAIVSDRRAPSGRPMIVHNRGWGVQLEDALFVDRITGHYRFRGDPAAAVTTLARAPRG